MKYNLKSDIIFKAFFGRKGNETFLKEFLVALLKIEIKKIVIKDEVSIEKLFKEEKGGRLDLLVQLNDGISIDIEMQIQKQIDYLERTSLYASKMMAREQGNGLKYGKLNQIILINILDFELLEVEDYLSETAIVLKKHREYEIIKNPKWYFIELPKFRKANVDMEDKLNQWLVFIDDYDRGKIRMAENKNKTLKEARNVMNYLTGDEEIRRLVELRERWEFDRNMDVKCERYQKAREIAQKLLKKGVSIEIIMESTGLTKEEIEELAI